MAEASAGAEAAQGSARCRSLRGCLGGWSRSVVGCQAADLRAEAGLAWACRRLAHLTPRGPTGWHRSARTPCTPSCAPRSRRASTPASVGVVAVPGSPAPHLLLSPLHPCAGVHQLQPAGQHRQVRQALSPPSPCVPAHCPGGAALVAAFGSRAVTCQPRCGDCEPPAGCRCDSSSHASRGRPAFANTPLHLVLAFRSRFRLYPVCDAVSS